MLYGNFFEMLYLFLSPRIMQHSTSPYANFVAQTLEKYEYTKKDTRELQWHMEESPRRFMFYSELI
jgi:hypothetical protein